MPISVESEKKLLAEIKARKWWQGSLISGRDLSKIEDSYNESEWWIIASQTCNIYNPRFENVPSIEIVAAKRIDKCDPGKIRGDNPRILHVEACSTEEVIRLELNIQNRRWCKRQVLAELSAPTFRVIDAKQDFDPDWSKKKWLDKFVGWLSHSYNRVTLPDAFNEGVRVSKIEDVFKKRLTKHKDELFGIYLSIHSDSDTPQDGAIGEMLPPYLLNIVLVVHENVDPEPIKKELLDKLFKEPIKDPEKTPETITRAQLARRHEIRLIESDIDARSVAEITLLELLSLIRYSFVDHLSDSSDTIL